MGYATLEKVHRPLLLDACLDLSGNRCNLCVMRLLDGLHRRSTVHKILAIVIYFV